MMAIFKGKGATSFGLLLVGTVVFTFVNKYVLWILKFQYPTIFQSWQMVFAFVFQLSAAVMGYIKFPSFSLYNLRHWIPCTALFAVQIYSGSVALTNLVVPQFCAMQCLTAFVRLLIECSVQRQIPRGTINVGLCLAIFGLCAASIADPEFRYLGYKWMLIHTCSAAGYSAVANRACVNHLGTIDRMFYNSFLSICYLLIIGYITGELQDSLNFRYIFYGRFHFACLISGTMCGVLVLTINHLKTIFPDVTMNFYRGVVLAVVAIISPLVFDMTLTIPFAFGISLALAGGLLNNFEQYNDDKEIVQPTKTTEC